MTVREILTKWGFEVDDRPLKTMQQSVESAKSTVRSMAVAFAAASASVGVFLQRAGKLEQAQIAFETLLGSAEKAQQLLREIQTFALSTPFQSSEVIDLSKRLLAFGFSMEEIIPTLTSLGNIAAGVGTEKLPQLILALGQVRAATVLRGQELRQFTEAGVPLLDELGIKFGKTAKEVQSMISAGQVTFEDVRQALQRVTSEGGRFANLMQRQSTSLLGLASTAIEVLDVLAQKIGTTAIPEGKRLLNLFIDFIRLNEDELISAGAAFLNMMFRLMRGLVDVMTTLFRAVTGLARAFGGLEKVLNVLLTLFISIMALKLAYAIGLITMGVWGMVTAVFALTSATNGLRLAIILAQAAALAIPLAIGAAVIALGLIIEDIVGFFTGKKSLLGEMLEVDWSGLMSSFVSGAWSLIKAFVTPFANLGAMIGDFIRAGIVSAIGGVGSLVSGAAGGLASFFGFGGGGSQVPTPGTSPVGGGTNNANTTVANVDAPITVNVPPGTPPAEVSTAARQGVMDAIAEQLRVARRQTAPAVEY